MELLTVLLLCVAVVIILLFSSLAGCKNAFVLSDSNQNKILQIFPSTNQRGAARGGQEQ
jgi:hypothetical protein